MKEAEAHPGIFQASEVQCDDYCIIVIQCRFNPEDTKSGTAFERGFVKQAIKVRSRLAHG